MAPNNKRMQDAVGVGANASKKSISSRYPQPVATNLALALVAKPISFDFQRYAHFAGKTFRPFGC